MAETKTEYPAIDIEAWCQDVIEGAAGFNDFDRREGFLQMPWKGERRLVAEWVIRCLANPRCEGSAEVLEAIRGRRADVEAGRRPNTAAHQPARQR